MRTSTCRALLGMALLGAAFPAPAEVRFGGDLGVSMSRRDDWASGAGPGITRYWFTGGLHLDASLFAPGLLDLGGSASYLGYRAGGGAASDALNYQLRLSALSRSPVSLGAAASRSTIDFTADTNSGRVGSTRVDSLTGTLVLNAAEYPSLSGSIRQSETVNRSRSSAEVRSKATSLNAEASQSVESLNYSLTYATGWASGDYAETNYRDHAASLRAQAQLATNFTAQVTATYNLRLPTLVSALNPRLDSQTLSTWFQAVTSPQTSVGGGYSYFDSLFDAPGSPLRQAISHSLSAYGSHQLNPQLAFDLNASASAGMTRLGTTEERTTGEALGVGVRWNRQLESALVQASVTGNAGAYQPAAGPDGGAWGIGGSLTLSRPLATWYGTAGLAGSYDRNTGATAGDRSRITGSLAASGSPLGWSFNGLLSGGYTRAASPTFGSTSQWTVRLDAQGNHGGFNLGLNAGLTDDLSSVLVPGAPPAALLVPVEFNTQTRYVMATATVPTIPNLFLTLLGRALQVASPGRDTTWESGLSVSAGYYIGAFQLSLYEQVTWGGSSGIATAPQNLIFLSASRSFGR